MEEKTFYLDSGNYTVFIESFHGPVPGKLSGPPEDCYPDEAAEVEFKATVEYAADEDTQCSAMDFDEFVKLYAKEETGGDEDKALSRIEDDTITDILEAADEYEP